METDQQQRPPGPLYQSFLAWWKIEPPSPWQKASEPMWNEWLLKWKAFAESYGLSVPLPLTTPQYHQ